VTGFMSVSVKAAGWAMLLRVFGYPLLYGGVVYPTGLLPLRPVYVPLLVFVSLATMTGANFAALTQNNLKRLLAYSTIAHAGYMMMGLATLTRRGSEAVLFYLAAYLLMNLGAFAVVAFLRQETGSENLEDYRGLVRRSPWMVVTLAFFLLSLLGIPPLVGFAAKFQVFSALWDEGNYYYRIDQPGLGATLLGLLVVGGLNSVLSAVYYLKVLKVMILDWPAEGAEGAAPRPLAVPLGPAVYATVLAVAIFAVGLAWNPLMRLSNRGTNRFWPPPLQDTITQVQS
jgi:NADH-quinone oxidoreductase subunit N